MDFVDVFVFNDKATAVIDTYVHSLSLHDALPISATVRTVSASSVACTSCGASSPRSRDSTQPRWNWSRPVDLGGGSANQRSEEHTSELQSLMRISYAVFCLKKKIPLPYSHLTILYSPITQRFYKSHTTVYI